MERFVLENLLDKINGCTFANIDATTEPSNGIRKETTGIRVILFTNKKSSGYENMVKRRLIEAGKNPDNFVSGDLPWGEQVPNSPLVEHKGKVYLKCVLLSEGQPRYFIGNREVSGNGLGLRGSWPNQGLPPSDAVKVACYNLEHIKKITLMGETLTADNSGIKPLSVE
jgi:hypothetical protein